MDALVVERVDERLGEVEQPFVEHGVHHAPGRANGVSSRKKSVKICTKWMYGSGMWSASSLSPTDAAPRMHALVELHLRPSAVGGAARSSRARPSVAATPRRAARASSGERAAQIGVRAPRRLGGA